MFLTKTNEALFIQILEIANNFRKENENYLMAYSYFLDYFKALDIITLDHIVIGISFTYSWMPTILNMDLSDPENLVRIFNKAKVGESITAQEFLVLKKAFNNSLVGTSKLLHFINPEKYAIWDSRVFNFLTGRKPHDSRFQKPETYIAYLSLLETLKNEKNFGEFYNLIMQKVGYEISEYRALELAFFKGG